jgi:transcriptional regulator with XRE-family HTH domain
MLPIETQGTRVPAAKSHRTLPYLQAWRLQRLMTLRGLADAADVAVSTVVRGEAGEPVAALSAAKLARALGITVAQLREEPKE